MNAAAITAIMAEWAGSKAKYADRVTHLQNGSGGANGTTKLNATSLQSDGVADTVSGNADLDWFFQSTGDVLDAINGEISTAI